MRKIGEPGPASKPDGKPLFLKTLVRYFANGWSQYTIGRVKGGVKPGQPEVALGLCGRKAYRNRDSYRTVNADVEVSAMKTG